MICKVRIQLKLMILVKNQWYLLPNTIGNHCCYPGICIINYTVYVMGNKGYYSNEWGIVEFYDCRINKWQYKDEMRNMLGVGSGQCEGRLFRCVLT